jgi:HK97 family phage major capsid protein
MEKILQMRRDLAAKIQEARAYLDKIDLDKRAWVEADDAAYDAIMTAADQLRKSIDREERLLGIEGTIGKGMPPAGKNDPNTDDPKMGFRSFGDQLKAVIAAGDPQARVIDSRLQRYTEMRLGPSGMSESVPSDGGFLVAPEFAQEVLLRTYETGVLASRCRRIPTTSNELKINSVDERARTDGSRWGGILAYWEGEADALTGTKPKFRQIDLRLRKLTGLCYATDELLQDAAALQAVVMQGFSEEFGFKLDDSIIRGTGAGMPMGVLNSGSLVTVAKETNQAAATIVTENIQKMWMHCFNRSRMTAAWFYNQDCEPQMNTMSLPVGTGGIPVWLPPGGLSSTPYGTLFGRPAIAIEQADTMGNTGDIMLLDLGQYVLTDKEPGVQSAVSIHVRFLYDESVFRFIYRVDGQPIWQVGLTPFKGSNILSPFVALAQRS